MGVLPLSSAAGVMGLGPLGEAAGVSERVAAAAEAGRPTQPIGAERLTPCDLSLIHI